NGILPISTIMLNQHTIAELSAVVATKNATEADVARLGALQAVMFTRAVAMTGMGLMLYAMTLEAKGNHVAAMSWAIVGGAIMGVAIAYQTLASTRLGGPAGFAVAAASGAVAGYAYMKLMREMMKSPELPEIKALDLTGMEADYGTADLGMRVPARTYDTGGRPNHQMVYVEPGETITSKTQNMLGGASGEGVVINIHGDIYDSDKFKEKVAEVLPRAFTFAADRGSGIMLARY
ncbi:hypothetical protein CMI37_21570, partial [Candidatus Pacearchaeota archaeon]|nr:hypothetical protein [Candidatus Pacearchaeota archaeon]